MGIIEAGSLGIGDFSEERNTLLYSQPPIESRSPAITRFSREQQIYLEEKGWIVYGLTGQSIKSLKNLGKRFFNSEWFEIEYPGLASMPSLRSEVAINLNQLYLPESERKSFPEQQELVREHGRRIAGEIGGMEAVIGELPDYAELFFKLPPRLRFPREPYYPVEVRTRTAVMRGLGGEIYSVAELNDYGPDQGIEITDGNPTYTLPNKVVVPLLFPSEKNKGRRRRIRRPLFQILNRQLDPKPFQI